MEEEFDLRKFRENLAPAGNGTSSSQAQPLCKWTVRGKECKQQGSCTMRHEPTSFEEERIRFQLAQKQAVLAAQHDSNDPFTQKQNKRLRAQVFSEWVLRKFGRSRLETGSGILDVAGGAGELTCEFIISQVH